MRLISARCYQRTTPKCPPEAGALAVQKSVALLGLKLEGRLVVIMLVEFLHPIPTSAASQDLFHEPCCRCTFRLFFGGLNTMESCVEV